MIGKCPKCGQFPPDIQKRAKEWADVLDETTQLVKQLSALRTRIADTEGMKEILRPMGHRVSINEVVGSLQRFLRGEK